MIFFAISARDLRLITSSSFGAPATVSEREEELESEHVVAIILPVSLEAVFLLPPEAHLSTEIVTITTQLSKCKPCKGQV